MPVTGVTISGEAGGSGGSSEATIEKAAIRGRLQGR